MNYDDCQGIRWFGKSNAPTVGLARRSIRCICNLAIRIPTSLAVMSETLRQQYTVAVKSQYLLARRMPARGIRHVMMVRVFNVRGQVLAGAVVSDRYAPGVARIHEGHGTIRTKAASQGAVQIR